MVTGAARLGPSNLLSRPGASEDTHPHTSPLPKRERGARTSSQGAAWRGLQVMVLSPALVRARFHRNARYRRGNRDTLVPAAAQSWTAGLGTATMVRGRIATLPSEAAVCGRQGRRIGEHHGDQKDLPGRATHDFTARRLPLRAPSREPLRCLLRTLHIQD